MIEIKCFDNLTYDERMLRTSVFIEEQKFKEEFDEIDNDSLHLVLYTDDKALSAQVRASGFYEKLGYKKMGDIYYDEYCEHIHMEKSL